MKRGDFPTLIVSTTRFVRGSTRVTESCAELVTHTAFSPNASPNDPSGRSISATTVLVVGSMRARVPFLSIISHTLPAPAAMPPSESPAVTGIFAVMALLLRSIRATAFAPHSGTHRLSNPETSPEHGAEPLPSSIVTATVFVLASKRETLSFGSFDTQTASTSSAGASQSGWPPTSNTASGFSRSIGIFTPDVLTPGRGGLADGCAKSAVLSHVETRTTVTDLYMRVRA